MKKKPHQKVVPHRVGVLPNDACTACGTMMREKRGTLRLPVNGDEIAHPALENHDKLGLPVGDVLMLSPALYRTPLGSAHVGDSRELLQ